MGKLVTFWSPCLGHGKATASLCAVAGGFMLNHPELSIAISHTQRDSLSLAEKLDNREVFRIKKELYENLGINALKMYFRQSAVSEEIILRCGIPLMKKPVYLYPNVQYKWSEEQTVFQIIAKQLRQTFDIVFLDLESGNRKNAIPYMKEADCPVIVLPQEPAYAEPFLQDMEELLDLKEYGIIFGGCFKESRYSSNYYKNNSGKKVAGKIFGEIYLNNGFFDAMSGGRTLDYFLRNQLAVKKEDNYEFICQAKKTAECISKKIGIT